MSYKLFYSKTAFDDIKKLDSVARKRVKKKIETYSQNPLSHAKKLVDSKIGNFRWRVGKYRVVFDIRDKDILILRIGHRREIYR